MGRGNEQTFERGAGLEQALGREGQGWIGTYGGEGLRDNQYINRECGVVWGKQDRWRKVAGMCREDGVRLQT